MSDSDAIVIGGARRLRRLPECIDFEHEIRMIQ